MEILAEIVKGFQLSAVFAKSSMLDVLKSSEYVSELSWIKNYPW